MLTPTELTISGCKVKFPAKAYGSQIAMMSKIILSLQRSQNSLLESPTGSGKSLALLCASLAWQETEQKKVTEFNSLLEQATANQDPAIRDALLSMAGPGVEMQDEPVGLSGAGFNNESTAPALDKLQAAGEGGGFIPDPDEDDFAEPSAKRQRTIVPDENSVGFHLPAGDVPTSAPGSNLLRMPKKQKVPTIFFGTRTHKQVSQIVRELNKTAYSGVRMTILGSREHTCIHPTISRSFNKNQDCQELMDKKKGGGCRFQMNVKSKLASHYSLRFHLGHEKAWDLEDIVKVGKKVKCCPYFSVRELRSTAQLVICPYNYLVDPKIRKSMEINLKNQIVVLDEAHNIEDSARDAVSGSFNIDDIAIAMQECEKMVGFQILEQVHSGLADFCSRLANWMQKCVDSKPDYSDFNSSSRVWTGTSGIAEWNEMVFAPSNYTAVKSMLEDALKEQAAATEEQEAGEENTRILSKKATDVLDGIFMLLEYMNTRESMYRDDYRMAVVRSQARKKGGAGKGWMGKGENALVNVINLHFWCLNPAVCFNELKDVCRSIVLTSGTLSPIVTFASELDVKFPITLEADHVIDRKQVWVGTLSHGPTGHNLNATYRNTETLTFQDEIGKLVESMCRNIPHGILVFLPSYKMLDNMVNRWQATGTWAGILEKKTIVQEPRFSDQLDGVMREFYDAVAANNGSGETGQDGALFLAVCRGKVSEGLDFADNNARGVICVGIPFPNIKDSLVDLKKKYNDRKRSGGNGNVLSGGEWYEIQAFRALNQALGRCIRHRKDWGAILMVDDRYKKNERYVNGLSKWVRKGVVHYNNTRDMFHSLNMFTSEMKQMEHDDAEKEKELLAQSQALPSPSKSPVTIDSVNRELAEPSRSEEKKFSAWSSEQETISSKLSKLQEFKRQVSQKLEKDRTSQGSALSNLDYMTNLDSVTHLNSTSQLNTNSLSILSLRNVNKVGEPVNKENIQSKVVEPLHKTKAEENLVKKFESRRTKVADLIFDDSPDFCNDDSNVISENPNTESVIEVSDDETESKEIVYEPVKEIEMPQVTKDSSLRIPELEGTLDVSEKSIFLGGVDNMVDELKPSYSRWAQMFRKRKEKREMKKSSKNPEPDATIIPDTPEKGTVFEDTINWDDECLPPSEGEDELNFSSRKPLFPTSNTRFNGKQKDRSEIYGSPENKEIKRNTSSTNSSCENLNCRDLTSPEAVDILETDSSFTKGKSSSKLKKKKMNRSTVFPKISNYNSDDDFI